MYTVMELMLTKRIISGNNIIHNSSCAQWSNKVVLWKAYTFAVKLKPATQANALQYLRRCWSYYNRMLYGTCTITKALGASLYLTDYMWYFWKYVLGMYATLGVYCMYAFVGVYCMYATVRFLLWTRCPTGQKCHLSVIVGCFFLL